MKRMLSFLGVLIFAMQAQSVFAHATPIEYIPASSSVLEDVPGDIRIRFSERIEPGASGITVYASDGSRVNEGFGKTDPADARVFSVPVKSSGSGTYTVSWQVVSADDGHFTRGAYVFSVGEASGPALSSGQFQIQHRSGWPEAIMIWLELLGEAILLGCFVLMLVLGRPMKRHGVSVSAERLLARRLRLLVAVAGGMLFAGSIGYLLLKSGNLAVDRAVPVSEAFWSFLATVAGRYTVYRLVLGMILTALFLWNLRPMLRAAAAEISKSPLPLWILIIVIALLRARVSHAAASSFLPVFSVLMNAAHLLFKDLWIGGLIALVYAFLPALEMQKDTRLSARSLIRFSDLALLSILGGGLSGVYIVWLHLKSPANLFTTHWGGYFLALGAYALVFFLLRLYQQRVVLPALAQACEGKGEQAEKERSMNVVLLTEMFIGIAVLLFSSVLIITTPPLSPQNFYEQSAQTPQGGITLGEHPLEDDQFLITVQRPLRPSSIDDEYSGNAGSGTVMTVTLENAEKGIGPIVADTQMRFPGGYVFPKLLLSPPGEWTIGVTEHEATEYDVVHTFTVRYPDDVQAVHAGDHARGFGLFEGIAVLVAVLIIVLAGALRRENRRFLERCARGSSPAGLPPLTIAKPVLVAPFSMLLVVFIGLNFGGHNHGGGTFVKACGLNGGVWHESVPMRGGTVTSGTASLGCMMGDGRGQFHFGDEREFAWFVRRESSYATMKTDPAVAQPGRPVTMTFQLKDDAGMPVRDLTFEHDRILHVIVVHEDLETFAHLHPEDIGPVTPAMLADAAFPVRYTFPKAGKYLVAADWTVRSQTFSQEFTVQVGQKSSAQNGNPAIHPLMAGSREFVTSDGMQVRLISPSSPLQSGVMQRLSYMFEDADGKPSSAKATAGKPVTDLQSYLAATMHLSVVKADLTKLIHTHAELPQSLWDTIFNRRKVNAKHVHVFLPERFGPELLAYVLFPTPGEYVLFGEVNRGGKIILTKFRVTAQ